MRYLLAGAFSRSLALVRFIGQYNGDAKLVVYDGINHCKWNGGRINRDIEYRDGLIDYYYKRGISIALTFSNPVIDLTDEVGNHLLKKFHADGNCIILVNDDLRQYIREKFPKYQLIYSITGTGHISVPMDDAGVSFYRDLETKYDWIVPRFEHIFDPRAIELDCTKWEVMLNDTCIWNCKHFDEHFKAIAHENTEGRPYTAEIEECWVKGFDPNIISKYNCMDIDSVHVAKLKRMGVHSFKITGREMDDDTYFKELIKYVKNCE